ncbi:MAG: hypothetical protein IPL23_09115 [Saprospiraceae bacterium]|nr:hypothetical protein [Saprospiraceae bacterium]
MSTLVDKLVILDLKGLSNVAYFTVAEYLITILLVPQKAITNSATPIIADAWRKNDTSELSGLYIKAANNLTWAGGLLYILLLVNINHIFALFPASYGVGKQVFIVLGIAKMIDFITSINSQILIYSKKYYMHELVFASILTVLLIPITYLLVSTFGIIGSAWAQVICLFIVNLVRIIFLWKMCGMNPFRTNYRIFSLSPWQLFWRSGLLKLMNTVTR